MLLSTAPLWNGLFRFLYRRIVLILTLLLCAGAGIALANMSSLSTSLIESQAIQNAALHAQSFQQAINLYSDTAADRAKPVPGIAVTHAYLNQPGGIPLPSTFALELGNRISDQNPDMVVRLVSEYPFPWRKAKGGIRDDIEKEAIAALTASPRTEFVQFDKRDGHVTLFYAEASIMKPTCVECHNTHPDSPKKDWAVGDVAGLWEIRQPLDQFVEKVNRNLRGTFMTLGSMSVLGISGLTLVVGRLRQTTRELEQRVQDRTQDLAQANTDLEKRNQLIRQVFGRYLSDAIVGTLLDQPTGLHLGGERRTITILTSDLRGFSSLAERLPPEQVIEMLNLYLEDMAEVINQYQGTIDEFMGDGILVLFGAPLTQPADALRAVACACAMQLRMGAVNEKLQARSLPQLAMGIGINTGEVIVGNIGSEQRTKYGVVGSSVNLTYRIESFTQGGQILISEQTRQAVGQNVQIAATRQVHPKGFEQPIQVYEVYGVKGRYNLFLPKGVG
ncbi:MAG: adenylate/guanylate cyclase domain-containing protein [Elainella sp.]